MATYVVSDLHLMDRQEDYLFNQEKEKAFVLLCQSLKPTDQLILAGDIFDLTGMTPCRYGQKEFFDEVVPLDKQNPDLIRLSSQFRTTFDLLTSTKKVFPDFFCCLQQLAINQQLIFIPGNHDCDFLQVAGKKTLAEVLGVNDSAIQWKGDALIGSHLAVVHGNQFDPANRTDHGCHNPGFTFTSALYHAVLPALRMLGVHPMLLAALPAVRPEEESVVGIQHYLNKDDCQRLLIGFARLLQRNEFFFGRAALPSWFLNHSVPFFSKFILNQITPERVRSVLPKDADVMKRTRRGCEKLLAELILSGPQFKNATIVAGHTHQMDLTANYVNLGTWIDHIDSLSPSALRNTDSNLPVFVVTDKNEAYLFDIRKISTLKNIFSCPVLWSKNWNSPA